MSYIEIKKLNKSFALDNISSIHSPKNVLKDISLSIEKGEIVSLLGSSGCGKTTLAKCILGLEKYNGEILIGGENINQYLKHNRIGYVPQKYANFEHLTVYQNALIAFDKPSESDREKIDHALKVLGIYKSKDMYPKALSGGMKQRLAIARALLTNSDIIVFDEPLSALDIETKHQTQELLLQIWQEYNKTFIFITHDIEEALFLSHKVVILETNPGKIREVISSPFDFPRVSTIRYEKTFQDIRKSLSYIIRSESLKGLLFRDSHVESTTSTISNSITFGLYVWPGNAPFYYADDNGWLGGMNKSINLISFSDNAQKNDYFEQGKIDVLHVTLNQLEDIQKRHKNIYVLAELDKSFGADGIVTTLPIRNVCELKGQKIAVEKNEVGHFFLKYVLAKNNMNEDDIQIVDMKTEEIGSAIISNKIQTGVLWEPWLSKAVELSGATILADTIMYDAPIDNILICKKSFYQNNKIDLDKVIELFKRGANEYKCNKGAFAHKTAHMVGMTENELLKTLAKISFN
ncbi:MAG: ATP-binding cassette domain-containing protein [Candidatus Pacebacteria bacterium]|nr:ATP-binding cassette domain-containing protein [Candidatus Paceibacterota bacterium]